jgi:hypothetical protein
MPGPLLCRSGKYPSPAGVEQRPPPRPANITDRRALYNDLLSVYKILVICTSVYIYIYIDSLRVIYIYIYTYIMAGNIYIWQALSESSACFTGGARSAL